jgi:hypothetical protein
MTTTTLGETSEQVIANLSVAVNTNMALQTLDLSATAITSSLFTDGVIEDLTIIDGGLFDAPPAPTVPALAPGGLFVLVSGLILCGFLGRAYSTRISFGRQLESIARR